MIKITVDGEVKGLYLDHNLEIGSSQFSDVRLQWIASRHMTLHFQESHFSVELHSEDNFEYQDYLHYRESGNVAVEYGETFKISYNCKPEIEDSRGDSDYTITVEKV